ncbi:hypothetical protein TNCV_353611 [Trichonephila clavipes]|nr:hypothetical protein TNCV_353611 [Trichonephila clavipes]
MHVKSVEAQSPNGDVAFGEWRPGPRCHSHHLTEAQNYEVSHMFHFHLSFSEVKAFSLPLFYEGFSFFKQK